MRNRFRKPKYIIEDRDQKYGDSETPASKGNLGRGCLVSQAFHASSEMRFWEKMQSLQLACSAPIYIYKNKTKLGAIIILGRRANIFVTNLDMCQASHIPFLIQ